MKLLTILIYFIGLAAYAQLPIPKVPSNMKFAGINLKISKEARKEMQKKVAQYTKNQKYFMIKVKRAASYFPIVEQIFKKENLPEDFKYLAIQESGYISDAVSSSNAVGYWQFKKATAEEVGLRVDNKIDERLNIVSASRGAAKYLKKNNLFLNNWVHTLQSYQMGLGGTKRALKKFKKGVKTMHITKNTYWYVLTFLAHKIAYEQAVALVRGNATPLLIYTKGKNKTLKEISKSTQTPLDSLKKYNTWLKTKTILADKPYAVIIPAYRDIPNLLDANKKDLALAEKNITKGAEMETTPIIKRLTINGLPAITLNAKLSANKLANKMNLSLSKFLSYNDISLHYSILPNQVYYLKRKMARAKIYYHTVKPNETLWSISQVYGVRMAKIKKMNRMTKLENKLKVGRVLWLRKIRPKKHPVEYK